MRDISGGQESVPACKGGETSCRGDRGLRYCPLASHATGFENFTWFERLQPFDTKRQLPLNDAGCVASTPDCGVAWPIVKQLASVPEGRSKQLADHNGQAPMSWTRFTLVQSGQTSQITKPHSIFIIQMCVPGKAGKIDTSVRIGLFGKFRLFRSRTLSGDDSGKLNWEIQVPTDARTIAAKLPILLGQREGRMGIADRKRLCSEVKNETSGGRI